MRVILTITLQMVAATSLLAHEVEGAHSSCDVRSQTYDPEEYLAETVEGVDLNPWRVDVEYFSPYVTFEGPGRAKGRKGPARDGFVRLEVFRDDTACEE